MLKKRECKLIKMFYNELITIHKPKCHEAILFEKKIGPYKTEIDLVRELAKLKIYFKEYDYQVQSGSNNDLIITYWSKK